VGGGCGRLGRRRLHASVGDGAASHAAARQRRPPRADCATPTPQAPQPHPQSTAFSSLSPRSTAATPAHASSLSRSMGTTWRRRGRWRRRRVRRAATPRARALVRRARTHSARRCRRRPAPPRAPHLERLPVRAHHDGRPARRHRARRPAARLGRARGRGGRRALPLSRAHRHAAWTGAMRADAAEPANGGGPGQRGGHGAREQQISETIGSATGSVRV
jgi:hypothetical protein